MIKIDIEKKLHTALGKMNLSFNTEIKKGSFTTIYGKSGVGKTSILKIIAGILHPEKGKITVNNHIWLDTDKKINIPPQKRKVGFVFQDYALFPNMTVRQNLQFALNNKKNEYEIDDMITLMELTKLENKKPETLSGGQKQRVALARAAIQKPSLLLLDEPLSALDEEIRGKIQDYLLQIHKKYHLTTLLVSHNISEILKLSDEIIKIDNGKIIAQGTPSNVFKNNSLSAKFMFTGTIIAIETEDFLFIITLQINQNMVKVVTDYNQGCNLKLGDKVWVGSKAFNPIIKKITSF